jgi:hypothetical protein
VKIKQSDNTRAVALLLKSGGVAIVCLAQPARSTIVTSIPTSKLKEIDRVSFSEAMAQFSNNNGDEKFKRGQLKDRSLSTTVSNVKDVDGWSQQIGWLYGVLFVVLATLAVLSRYNRNH